MVVEYHYTINPPGYDFSDYYSVNLSLGLTPVNINGKDTVGRENHILLVRLYLLS
jgi:hypothetical protein